MAWSSWDRGPPMFYWRTDWLTKRRIALGYFGGNVEYAVKDDSTPASAADLAVETGIIEILERE